MKSFGWVLAIVLIVTYSDEITRDLNAIMKDFNLETLSLSVSDADMTKKSCDDLVDLLTGKSIKNDLGGQFEIIKIKNPRERSKSVNRIECTGTVYLDTGKETLLNMSMYLEDGEIYWKAETLY